MAGLPVDSTHRLVYYRDLLFVLVERDMRLRYKRSVLGLLWTLLNPLSQLLVFYFVFGVLFRIGIPRFPAFLFVGIVAWNWFSGSLHQATGVFVDSRGLVQRPGFPVAVLPAVTITSHLIHYVLTLPIVFGLIWFYGLSLEPVALLFIPLLILFQFLLMLGIAYTVASAHVRYRDTQYLVGLALMLGFYLTPIFYSSDIVPQHAQGLYRLNPMVHLVESYRAVFLDARSPDADSLVFTAGAAILSLTVGYLVFYLRRGDFHREL